MKQTAATFLVKAPSLNTLSGFDPPHQRHLHPISPNQRLPKFFAIAPSWFTFPRQPSAAVQQQPYITAAAAAAAAAAATATAADQTFL